MSCDGGGNDDTDTDAPDAPVITSPVNGATIKISTVTISGTAEVGSTVELLDMNDTAPIGTAKADFNGDWSLTISPLADGVHNLTATATDADCNTSSPSTALIITVDTTVLGYADIPKLDCSTLLTIDDIDEALAYERDTVDFEKGEVCRTYIYSDERVFVQIEPGWPADFFPATELVGVYGEPVSGVGDDARWFFGTGSAGGPVGVLSVRQVIWLGVLYFRIAVGRPDLNTAEMLDLVKGLALNALPRFLGVGEEPPTVIPPPEPGDTSSRGYAENLLEKEADGEWTRGEGLVATLRLFAGEVDPDEVLRHPDMIDLFGSGIIRMAQEYLESCGGDPAAKSEIERLLAVVMQPPPESETEGASEPFELDTPERLMTQQEPELLQLPEDCEKYYYEEDNCWRSWDIDPDVHGEGTYRLMGPYFPTVGWTNDHVEMFLRAMTKTIDELISLNDLVQEHNIIPPPITIRMINMRQYDTVVGSKRTYIYAGTYFQEIAARNEDHAEQLVAYLIAYATLKTRFPWAGIFADDAWVLAGSMFLSDVVYPDAQMEQEFLHWTDYLREDETSRSMLDYDHANWAFLEHIFDISIVLDLLKTPVNGIGGFPYIKDYIHGYAKKLTTFEIPDMGSPHSYWPPTQYVWLSNRGNHPFPIRAYRPLRVEFSVDGGDYACVSFPTPPKMTPPQVSWSYGIVGDDLLWNQDLPAILYDNAVFIVTSTEHTQFDIKVLDFVEDPEDCQEEDDGNGTDGCVDCGICGCTDFIK
jgi:hypothetical protein